MQDEAFHEFFREISQAQLEWLKGKAENGEKAKGIVTPDEKRPAAPNNSTYTDREWI